MKSLTPREVADMLKITTNTVYELVKRGELNAYRIGRKMRIEPSDVEEYKRNTSTGSYIEENHNGEEFPKGLVLCGQDLVLDVLARYLETEEIGVPVFRSHQGSYNGLYALYRGDVQVATSHLWDGETGEYNISYIKSLVPGIPTVIIHLVCRTQGFYVKKGNPLGIKGWQDLIRSDIKIINREKGSGVRVLLDEQLKLLGKYGSEINGYERERTSHIEIASIVAREKVDLGIGTEIVAKQVEGIDFIPLQKESIELVFKKEDLNKLPFKKIVEILKSKEFANEIEGIGGYDIRDMGKIL